MARRPGDRLEPAVIGDLALIGGGAALGGIGRHLATTLLDHRLGPTLGGFPIGTMAVNVVGSLLLGLLLGSGPANGWRLFLGVGLLGGFTTFSSFSVQTVRLLDEGQLVPALVKAVGSLILCVLAAWLGHRWGMLWLATSGPR